MPDPNARDLHRVVWRDVMSNDTDRAAEFFTELLGWEVLATKAFPPHGSYRLMGVGDRPECGVVPLGKTDDEPSHVLAYVSVADVAATCREAEAAGGTVVHGPAEIPEWGTFAVLKDPTGGVLAAFRGLQPYRPADEGDPPAGCWVWEELLCTAPEAGAAFYGAVFGWTTEDVDMGELGTYHLLRAGERQIGGLLEKPAEAPGPSAWLSYVRVDDVDAQAKRAAELGAQTYVAPRDIPGVGRFAVHGAPEGTMFALFRGAGT